MNVEDGIESGVVTVRISDHLPIFSLIGGESVRGEVGDERGQRRVVNGERVRRFAERLEKWDFRVLSFHCQ